MELTLPWCYRFGGKTECKEGVYTGALHPWTERTLGYANQRRLAGRGILTSFTVPV